MKQEQLYNMLTHTLPKKSQHIQPVLNRFKHELEKLYGSRLKQLILYGSYARGDFREFSDIDILVVLDNMESPGKEIRFTGNTTHNYLMTDDLIISLLPTSEKRFNQSKLGVYVNIKKEGVLL